ncbi:MAG: PAS domain S-box protein [Planctomycetes bacterium]|nr:PAS domain S-box protein [Planctomycetota bacterium]
MRFLLSNTAFLSASLALLAAGAVVALVAEGVLGFRDAPRQAVLVIEGLAVSLIAVAGILLLRDIEHRRREDQSRTERARLAAFAADVGFSLSAGSTVPGILLGCTNAMVRHLDAAYARVWTYDEVDRALELEVSSGLHAHIEPPYRRIPLGRLSIGRIARDRQSLITNQAAGDPRLDDAEWVRREGMVAFAGHPLLVGHRLIGVMAMYSRRPLGEFALKALAAAAAHIALGVERRRTEDALAESEARVRSILDTTADAILTVDEAGHIEEANPAAERLFGAARAEIVGRSVLQFIPEPGAGEEQIGGRGVEVEVRRPDAAIVPVELNVSEVTREPRRLHTWTLRDITERRAVQAAILHAKEASEAANRAKSEFLSSMSHELRTPLNSVIGFANLLLKNKAGNLSAQDLLYLDRVHDNGKHLLRIINSVLDLSKIEAGRMDLVSAPVRLDLLVREVLALLEPQTRDRDLVLRAKLPARVEAIETDEDKMRQVLLNLVGNALKFTERGSVTVRVNVDDATSRPTLLEVEDTGIGIPRERQASLFEAFQQIDCTTARKYGGTGLGLALSRSFLHLLGYSISVQSEPGRGSLFRIALTPAAAVTRQVGTTRRLAPRRSDAPNLTMEPR